MERQPDQTAEPVTEFELGDGSRLVLENESDALARCRPEGADSKQISLEDALSLSGEPFAGYRLDRRDSRRD
jgi:hypothetical protein